MTARCDCTWQRRSISRLNPDAQARAAGRFLKRNDDDTSHSQPSILNLEYVPT